MDYCRYSAMPAGRFILDVHGESRTTWLAADNICAAFQVINHLQDYVQDYRNLDRVYLPLDALAATGATLEALGAPKTGPELLACLHNLAERTGEMVERGSELPIEIKDQRLALAVSGLVTLARRYVQLLRDRDPLSERVRLTKFGKVTLAARGAAGELFARLVRSKG